MVTSPVRTLKNSIGMEFVLIPAGRSQISHIGPGELGFRIPDHQNIIMKSFYLGKYPVTQEQWEAVMGDHPSCFDGDGRPVECISWNEVQNFIKELNSMEETDKYSLPAENEWEYACKAGTGTRYSFGDSEAELDKYSWYYGNSEHMTHPVGQKEPNPWGLYDMHGNVWEWCKDKHHWSYEEALEEGTAWELAGNKAIVLRGGSWVNDPEKCYSISRSNFNSDYGTYSVGFRLLRSL
ncbi:formylglycine-generating enzyme family protein [Methanolobus sp. WCC4]|uniref:formylglycine-generating enzyme family protein n=1 Tax=Methanolobus sp. WCC4 TaxID=3125784 RepID=UPI0030F89D81